MASNTAYRPVGIEEDMTLNSNRVNDAHSPYSHDYTDGTDVPRKSVRGMIGICSFSLIILGVGVVFLLGVCLGFYVRELQKEDIDLDKLCGTPEEQEIDYDKLGGYHETLVYYIRGEEIRKFVDEFGTADPLTGSAVERRLEEAVLEEFDTFRFDLVEVEEHEIVVTSPDPNQPNRLQVVHSNGTLTHSFDLTNQRRAGQVKERNKNITGEDEEDTQNVEDWWKFPHVSFCPSGQTDASLVYGHYGLETDFATLNSLGIQAHGKTVLVRLGRSSVADKLMEAERLGAVSALLYWEDSDHLNEAGAPVDPKAVPYASAATYIEDNPGLWTPSIPCQTISTEQAHTLITLLLADLNPSPSDDYYDDVDNNGTRLSFPELYSERESSEESFSIKLDVYNKARKQKIRNVISTIQGIDETDHYTVVGSPRSWLPGGQPQDLVVSTSILLQLARSFKYVHNLHYWKPRRGIKFVSWGGAEFSNAGNLLYIQKRRHLLGRRAMAYIDLRQLVAGNESIAVHTSGSLYQLVKEVTFDIPDPRDDEQTIQSRWLQKKGNNSLALYNPLYSYGNDNTLSSFLHLVGVPTIKVQFQGKSGKQNVSAFFKHSYKHHYKFHIAATRILVMSLLSLLDNQILPINTRNLARDLEVTVWQTSAVLEQCSDDRAHLNKALSACGRFMRTADAFEEFAHTFVKRKDLEGINMVNKVKVMIERLFTVRQQGSSHHILYPSDVDGSIQRAVDLCQLSAASKTLRPMAQFGRLLEGIIREADLALKIGA